MRCAVFYGPGNYKIEERPIPKVGPDDLLIKVEFCGICGTDVHLYKGSWPIKPPAIPGHELSGVVVEIGNRVKGFQVGDGVTVDPNIACGECHYCRLGKRQLCQNRISLIYYSNGGFAEYCVAPTRQTYRLPKDMPLEWGAFTEPVACCLHGIDFTGIKPGDTVAIMGAGAIGLIMLQLVLLSGASRVIVIEPIEGRRRLAKTLKASELINPQKEEVVSKVREITNYGVDVAIECAGLPLTVEQSLAVVKDGGKILLFGVCDQEVRVSVSPYEVFRRELNIRGSFINPYTSQRAIELISREKVKIAPLITHHFPLEKIEEAIQMHMRNEGIKLLINPGGRA